jgi:hypothetical protein
MRAADIVTASIFMALGGLVLFDAVRLGFRWGSDGPQSGFFPFWLAIFLVTHCAVILIRALRQTGNDVAFVSRERLAPVLNVLWPAVAMVVLTHVIGLYVAGAVYMAFYMRWTGRHSWAAALAVPVSFSLATFVIFEKWFLLPLPKGPLETWLGY